MSADGSKMAAFGDGSGTELIVVSSDAGATWSTPTAVAATTGWQQGGIALSGDGGTLLLTHPDRGFCISRDMGATLACTRAGTPGIVASASTSFDGRVLVVGADWGRVFVSRDGGGSWSHLVGFGIGYSVYSASAPGLRGIVVSSDGSLLVADEGTYLVAASLAA